MRITTTQIAARKNAEKITAITCYDFSTAKIIDGEVDILLVGDSLGMVIYGFETTLPVTLDLMINHGKAVVSGSKKSLVVIDMPYGTFQKSKEDALQNANKIIAETKADAVKLEGGVKIAATVEAIVKSGIPVIGHIGLEPQSVEIYGGYKVQGRDEETARKIKADAKALEKAGAFAIVIEGIPASLASEITKEIKIPTIGIGASVECDGQVLVINDLLGYYESGAKFVKTYADFKTLIRNAVQTYSNEVRNKKFPTDKNTY